MAKIPYCHNAWIDPPKIPFLFLGKHRRTFERFGLTLENDGEWMVQTLLEIVRDSDFVGEPLDNGWGWVYHFYELKRTSKGKRLPLLSVWIVRHGEQMARFVTAYPHSEPFEGKEI